jgi:membrane protein DedA with SNARE-associated domain
LPEPGQGAEGGVDDWIAQVLAFIEANRAWTFWIALAFAFGETIAIVSILIPSTVILIGVGSFAATGAIDFLPLWAGAALGSLLGSTLSWWLGRKFGHLVFEAWPLNEYPENVEKGRAAFAKWGTLAVFIGHFFGPLRSVVFLMAGMSRIGFFRFQAVNVPGALAWAYVIPKFGEVGGIAIGWIWRLFGA